MRFFPAFRILGAAALLTVSGCDFWDNLLDEKTVAKAGVTLQLEDAWLKSQLPDAQCEDSVRSLAFTHQGAGKYSLNGVPTGKYVVKCEAPHYHPIRAGFSVPAKGAQVTLKLARKGGLADWYPDPGLRVDIATILGAIRYPTAIGLNAEPSDTTGAFRYEWEFRSAGGMSQGLGEGPGGLPVSARSLRPYYEGLATEANGVKTGPDTVILRVYSGLDKARGEYLAGEASLTFDWVRNRLPFVDLIRTDADATYKVGCAAKKFFKVTVRGGDSDGVCDSIRIYAKGVGTSFGRLDKTIGCSSETILPLELLLPSPAPSMFNDQRTDFRNILYAEAIDDNGEKAVDTLTVVTYSNILPIVNLRMKSPATTYFERDYVPYFVNAYDSDGQIDKFIFGEGGSDDKQYPMERNGSHYDSLDFTYQFNEARSYQVKAQADDDCPDASFSDILRIKIHKDSVPVIRYINPTKYIRRDTLFHAFDMELIDQNIADKVDHFTIIEVDWGDGTTPDNPEPDKDGNFARRTLQHHYAKAPVTGSVYPIRIIARDNHNGQGEHKAEMPY